MKKRLRDFWEKIFFEPSEEFQSINPKKAPSWLETQNWVNLISSHVIEHKRSGDAPTLFSYSKPVVLSGVFSDLRVHTKYESVFYAGDDRLVGPFYKSDNLDLIERSKRGIRSDEKYKSEIYITAKFRLDRDTISVFSLGRRPVATFEEVDCRIFPITEDQDSGIISIGGRFGASSTKVSVFIDKKNGPVEGGWMQGEISDLVYVDFSDGASLSFEFPLPASTFNNLVDELQGFGRVIDRVIGRITAELFQDELEASLGEGLPSHYGLLIDSDHENEEDFARAPARLDLLSIERVFAASEA
jgi:hypothetical protein